MSNLSFVDFSEKPFKRLKGFKGLVSSIALSIFSNIFTINFESFYTHSSYTFLNTCTILLTFFLFFYTFLNTFTIFLSFFLLFYTFLNTFTIFQSFF